MKKNNDFDTPPNKNEVSTNKSAKASTTEKSANTEKLKNQKTGEKDVASLDRKEKKEPKIEKVDFAAGTSDNSQHVKSKDDEQSEKQKIVENADLLSLLLAKSDPGLIKVLLDNSSPENLNVFLQNSNISIEELKDIVAY